MVDSQCLPLRDVVVRGLRVAAIILHMACQFGNLSHRFDAYHPLQCQIGLVSTSISHVKRLAMELTPENPQSHP